MFSNSTCQMVKSLALVVYLSSICTCTSAIAIGPPASTPAGSLAHSFPSRMVARHSEAKAVWIRNSGNENLGENELSDRSQKAPRSQIFDRSVDVPPGSKMRLRRLRRAAHPSTLSQRASSGPPPGPPDWNTLYNSGVYVNKKLGEPETAKDLASPFTDFEQLAAEGWQGTTDIKHEDTKDPEKEVDFYMQDVYKELRINVKNNHYAVMEHVNNWDDLNHVDHDPTHAHYASRMNFKDGMIIGTGLISPQQATMTQAKPPKTPPLNRWSDVVFLQWSHLGRGHAGGQNIKYFIMYDIYGLSKGLSTQLAIDKAIKNSSMKKAPVGFANKLTLNMNNEDAIALLGTSYGIACAGFLIGHKKQLGKKKITSISIWTTVHVKDDHDNPQSYAAPSKPDDAERMFHLMFHVK